MRKNSTLTIMPVMVAILFFIPSQVTADQPYMGGYLRGSVATTNKVLLAVNFVGTDPSQFPSDKWLMGVPSVAGGNGLSVTGWVHQSLVALYNDNDVIWAPQAWSIHEIQYPEDQPEWIYSKWIGRGDHVAFYLRMDISSGNIVYKAYVYQGFLQLERDAPRIYTWSHSTDDDNFLVGRRWRNWKYFKHFQFGVESNEEISETAWKVLNDNPCYYDGTNWRYLPGYSARGANAWITWGSGREWAVGGLTYSGVNKEYSGNDIVAWKRTGTTIGNDKKLWGGSGTVSDTVSKPYQ